MDRPLRHGWRYQMLLALGPQPFPPVSSSASTLGASTLFPPDLCPCHKTGQPARERPASMHSHAGHACMLCLSDKALRLPEAASPEPNARTVMHADGATV